MHDGEPVFVARDVCTVLDIIADRDAVARLDDDERVSVLVDTLGGTQSVTAITESGLYSLILRSRKPEARAFKRWVTHEVLPAIRTTGTYTTPTNELDQIKALHSAVGTLLAKVEIDAPKVEAYDRFLDSSSLIKIEVAGRQAGIGRKTVFGLLREAGVIQRYSRAPMQQYARRFKEVASTHENSAGEIVTDYTTKVRPEHFDWLVGRLEALAGGKAS